MKSSLVIGLLVVVAAGCAREAPLRDSSGPYSAWPPPASSAGAEPLRARYSGWPAVEVHHGKAVYYSDALAGRSTASGERYDPRAFTAASRSLPFGTVLRVVRHSDGRDVYVRVNDRGPFGDDARIVDLSGAAADTLDMRRAGVVDVTVEVVALGSGPRRR